jgi:hypothetical protein
MLLLTVALPIMAKAVTVLALTLGVTPCVETEKLEFLPI